MSIQTMTSIAMLGAALSVAAAQPYDGVRDCEAHATTFYKARDAEFRSFAIDRNTVEESQYEANVGSQHVTAVFRGRGTYTDSGRKFTGTFLCLHAGAGKGAVFLYLFPR
jgi:hypothetical protein